MQPVRQAGSILLRSKRKEIEFSDRISEILEDSLCKIKIETLILAAVMNHCKMTSEIRNG